MSRILRCCKDLNDLVVDIKYGNFIIIIIIPRVDRDMDIYSVDLSLVHLKLSLNVKTFGQSTCKREMHKMHNGHVSYYEIVHTCMQRRIQWFC
jgi:hypothetical protein